MISRILATAAAAAATVLTVPAVASAAPGYPVVTAPATVSASTVGPGGTVVFGGGGFAAGTLVTTDVTYISGGVGQSAPIVTRVVRTGYANSSGVYTATLTLTAPGVAQLTATGDKPDNTTLQLTAVVTVTGSVSGSGGSSSGGSGSGSGSTGSGSGGSASGSGGSTGSGSTGSGTAGGNYSGGSDVSALPRTGADNLGTELWIAGGLVAVGAAFVSVSVARRRTRA